MLTIRVQTALLNRAIGEFIKGTKKDIKTETLRQAKFLCLELATLASPRPKGVHGLAAAIPKIWGRRIRGQMGSIVKGVRSLGLFALARLNDATALKNSYYPTKVGAKMRTVFKKYSPAQLRAFERKQLRGLRGDKRAKRQRELQTAGTEFQTQGYERTEISALHRIMEAAKKNPQSALKNLRQVLKARLSGSAPTVYGSFMGRAVDAYYTALKDKSQRRIVGSKKTNKVYINTSDPRQDRELVAAQIDRHIGTVKAGWVQAGLAIPVKAGPRIPAWLKGQRAVGQGQVATSGLQTSVGLLNTVGNAGGMDDRTDYVRQALRSRQRKVVIGLREALKAQGRKWYIRNKKPVPANLAPGNISESQSLIT